jgi:mannose-1-phosphate guanylyltransferase/mannose-6-phosphate isomerase
MNLYPVVLSGGSGTRLWPLSREAMPKQFLSLVSENSLFQETVLRTSRLKDVRLPVVLCNYDHRFLALENLEAIGVKPYALYLEPVGRNTGPAIAVAAIRLAEDDPESVMLVLPSDHYIVDTEGFCRGITQALPAAAKGRFVTFGITPRWAETGYGYIQRGAPLEGVPSCFHVSRFIEKPDRKDLEALLEKEDCYWNSGIFMFPTKALLDELEKLRPDILSATRSAVERSLKDMEFVRLEAESFSSSPSISIDYAIMEHTDKAVVLPVHFDWTDLGSWKALWEVGNKDEAGNIAKGDVHCEDVSGCYINGNRRMIAGIGLRNLIVVDTPDAILISDKDRVQGVRQIVDALRAKNRVEHLVHRVVHRPWGTFESLDSGHRFQVKRLTVKPGGKLSLQLHHHRAEHWIIVSGTARITCGDQVVTLSENQSMYVPIATRHRLENPGKIPLQVIEVQTGAYLDEDDIVRVESSYGAFYE